MRDACEIHTHTGYVSLGLKGMYRCHHRVCSAPIRPPCSLCCSGSSPAPCSSSIFCFVMATPKAEARAVAVRATATRRQRKEPPKPAKKQKGGKGAAVAAVAPKAPAKAPKEALRRRPRRCPSAHPSAPANRARDTYPRMHPYVSDMYRECILCVMYLRVKIHCILKRILNVS